jgi:hypothetical protein
LKKCTIVVKDEVNIKIEGLDLDVRKRLNTQFKYFLPYARHMPAYKLGRWDGCSVFFQLGGSTYLNLLPEILPVLEQYRYNIEIEDHRQDYGELSFELVTESTFSHKTWPPGHVMAGEPVVLRDYQIEVVNHFLENPQCLQEVATGAGKTLMTAALSASVEQYGRSIVVVPNKSLVVQTEEDYANLGLDVGVYFGDRKEIGKTHTICTWQSLNSMLKATKNGAAPVTIEAFLEDVICVIIDECFDGDTLVTTPNGKIPIKDLKPGDKVINLCEKTKQYKKDTIVKVHKNLTHSASEKMLELTFDNGVKTQVTANHKFLTNKGWVRADELTEDLEVIDINTYG